MSSTAERTAAASLRSMTTPPMSLLWSISSESTLTTTGYPIVSAAATASAAVPTTFQPATGIPYASKIV